MKKICVICLEKDTVQTVKRLRSFGAVHVSHQRQPGGQRILSLQDDIALAMSACDILSRRGDSLKVIVREPRDWRSQARHIIDLDKRIDQLKEYSRSLAARIGEWEKWGDFDPEDINELIKKDIHVRFYEIPETDIMSIDKELIVKKISSSGGVANCVVLGRKKTDIPYREVPPPKMSLSGMKIKMNEDKKLETELEHELRGYSYCLEIINSAKDKLAKELEFQQVVDGMGREGALAYLGGFIPVDRTDDLKLEAVNAQWAVSIEDPSPYEEAPTFLRNPAWVEKIKPVFSLLGIVPGYREMDVSALFLVFLSLFFGMLIGDAGYGLIYLLLTGFFHFKTKNKSARDIFILLYVFSGCAVVWGVLTGTFFGQEWLKAYGVTGIVPALNDVKVMQSVCFFIGAAHLSIAHLWRAALKAPSLSAIADAGWICILWTAFFLARTLILSEPFPSWAMNMAGAGIAAVVFFTNPQKNILKTVGEGLGTIALSLMNNFTDVVSYVRLFAVGLAGVAIAETTNNMAAGLGGGFMAVVAGIFIAAVGHGLNIVLGPMSVLVHGVRLNVLEFSGHANISWSGYSYDPLKE